MLANLVLVIWDDAEDPKEGWLDESEIDSFSQKSCLATSVGFVKSKTEKYVTLYADYIEGLGHYGRVTKIPISQVISIQPIDLTASS